MSWKEWDEPGSQNALDYDTSEHFRWFKSSSCHASHHPSTHPSILPLFIFHLSIHPPSSIHPSIHYPSLFIYPHPSIINHPSSHPLFILKLMIHLFIHLSIDPPIFYLSIIHSSSIHSSTLCSSIHPSIDYRNFQVLCCWFLAYPSSPIHEASNSGVTSLKSFLDLGFHLSLGFPLLITLINTVLLLSFYLCLIVDWASLVVQLVKNLPAMQETWVGSLGCKDPLGKGKATYSSILA